MLDSACDTIARGARVKVLGWYDNEWGYANRLLELAALIGPLSAGPWVDRVMGDARGSSDEAHLHERRIRSWNSRDGGSGFAKVGVPSWGVGA